MNFINFRTDLSMRIGVFRRNVGQICAIPKVAVVAASPTRHEVSKIEVHSMSSATGMLYCGRQSDHLASAQRTGVEGKSGGNLFLNVLPSDWRRFVCVHRLLRSMEHRPCGLWLRMMNWRGGWRSRIGTKHVDQILLSLLRSAADFLGVKEMFFSVQMGKDRGHTAAVDATGRTVKRGALRDVLC